MSNQNQNSHLTAIERTTLSFPARTLLNRNKTKGRVLDFGCGIGKDVELLKDKGFEVDGYDPFYFPEVPTEKYDTIFCFYVLNVLLAEQQAEVLMNVLSLLKPTGKAYFAVRRDIQYEGFRIHKIHKKKPINVPLNYLMHQSIKMKTAKYTNTNTKPRCIKEAQRQVPFLQEKKLEN